MNSANQDTIFDKILRGDIPAQKVHEDEHVLAFRDVNPQAPTHVLVIPKRKVARFAGLKDLPTTDVGEFFQGVARVAAKLGLEGNGYRIVINNGRDAQQTVEYIHAHILGGRGLSWPPG
jgi:histidine triad (HIT) family protein